MALLKEQRLNLSVRHNVAKSIRIAPIEVKLIQQTHNQAAMIIPKACVAKAHARNKIKRTCLELLRRQFQKEQIGGIIVRVYTAPKDPQILPKVLSSCIQKLRSL